MRASETAGGFAIWRRRARNPAAGLLDKAGRCQLAPDTGQPLDRFLPERFRADHAEHMRKFGETGVSSRAMGQLGAISGVRTDGEEFPIEASISQIEIAGEKFFTVILRDIGVRVRMEAALHQSEKMEALGSLARGVAHDFNNILAAILGHAELALDALAPDHPARDNLSQIRTASSRGGEVIAQILSFSHRQPSQRVMLQLNSVVAEALKLLRASLPATIDIQSDFGDASVPTVLADATQVHQIVMNLGTNAAYAMRGQCAGLLTIKVEAVHVDADHAHLSPDLREGQYLRLAISDNGCGMDRTVLARIFEPLFTTKPRGEGTGLGLSTVYGIMKGNGGAITVYSELGEGTTFHLYFPAAETATVETQVAPQSAEGGQGERVMVVDDDLVLMMMITRMLHASTTSPRAIAKSARRSRPFVRNRGSSTRSSPTCRCRRCQGLNSRVRSCVSVRAFPSSSAQAKSHRKIARARSKQVSEK